MKEHGSIDSFLPFLNHFMVSQPDICPEFIMIDLNIQAAPRVNALIFLLDTY